MSETENKAANPLPEFVDAVTAILAVTRIGFSLVYERSLGNDSVTLRVDVQGGDDNV